MNSFGRIFRITLYGSSHGEELGIVIDGCPVGIPIAENDFTEDINRRRPKGAENTARCEEDKILIRSGVYKGFTDGTPLLLSFKNKDYRDADYNFDGFFRPGTADFTAHKKYKAFNNPNGGGMFSGRMTLPLVAAAVVAKKILPNLLFRIYDCIFDVQNVTKERYTNLDEAIEMATKLKTSVGGGFSIEVKNIPIGIGEPYFDSVESVISHAIFSIPGARSISFANFTDKMPSIINGNGLLNNPLIGVNGGITNGNILKFDVCFSPPASISAEQESYNFKTQKIEKFTIQGRHDICYITRTPVIVEAMTAIALADLYLIASI